MERHSLQRGLTAIELIIVLAVTAILLVVGVPDFQNINEKRRLKGAAEAMRQDLRFARTEAIKRNQRVRLTFTGSGDAWCYGVALVGEACDCTRPDQCRLDGVRRVRDSGAFPGVDLVAASFAGGRTFTTFNPIYGTAGNGTAKLRSPGGDNLWVRLSVLGRARVCTPDTETTLGIPPGSCD